MSKRYTLNHLKQKYKVYEKLPAFHTSSLMNLTSVRIRGGRFIFVNQSLDLILPQTWKQLLIEPRVPLFLIEELGEILLRHGGFGGAGEHSKT